ncbi:MAG: DUF58 domain-containing protein [Nanoarchaeota archaeon]|nr:DUF58 domain-containing protein [Nanoarchaeota archaeon]
MSEKHKKKLKVKITPSMRVLNRALEGNWHTIFKGRGMEFAGYRQYILGDDASRIDWKASLRCNDVLIKELEEYHALNVFFLLDVSNSMLCSSTGQLKVEFAAELVSNLCFNILKSGDAVGMGLFSDKLVSKISPQKGQSMQFRVMDELSNSDNFGGNFDLNKTLMNCNSFLEEGTMIIIVSDFIGLKDNWGHYIRTLSRKYEMIGIMVHDPRDYSMPEEQGQYLLENPFTGEKIYIDSNQYKGVYEEEVKNKIASIRNVFEKTKMGFVYLKTDEDFEKPIVNYFKKRIVIAR